MYVYVFADIECTSMKGGEPPRRVLRKVARPWKFASLQRRGLQRLSSTWLSQMQTYPQKAVSYGMSKHPLGGLGPLLLCHHSWTCLPIYISTYVYTYIYIYLFYLYIYVLKNSFMDILPKNDFILCHQPTFVQSSCLCGLHVKLRCEKITWLRGSEFKTGISEMRNCEKNRKPPNRPIL